MKKVFIWPDWDDSQYKIIYRNRDGFYGGFRLIGTKFHPVGDFDGEKPFIPDEPYRLYKTQKGYRGFFTGRYAPDLDATLEEMKAMGADPLYVKYCGRKRYYAMRVDPKFLDPSSRIGVARLVFSQGTPLPEWDKIIALHDEMTNANDKLATLC